MKDIEFVRKEVQAWQKFRDNKNAKVNWQFTTEDARIELSRLYPTLDDWHITRISLHNHCKDQWR